VALTSTIFNFDIDLADADRGRYESIALRVAQHPSESDEYLMARVLAYCLEYDDGIGFSSGLSDPEEPTLAIRDLTGRVRTWVEIGTPDAARLHKASKAADRVVVYTHKDPLPWLRQLAGDRIHRSEHIEVRAFDRSLIAALIERLSRRMALTVSLADRHLFLAFDGGVIEGDVVRHALT
jgi:uncharacterized protein YaeQ